MSPEIFGSNQADKLAATFIEVGEKSIEVPRNIEELKKAFEAAESYEEMKVIVDQYNLSNGIENVLAENLLQRHQQKLLAQKSFDDFDVSIELNGRSIILSKLYKLMPEDTVNVQRSDKTIESDWKILNIADGVCLCGKGNLKKKLFYSELNALNLNRRDRR